MFAQLQWHGTPQPMQAAGFCCRPKLNGDDGDWQDEQLDDKKDETATVRARAEEVGAPGKLSVVCFCCCCFCCCCCCEDGPLVVCRMRRGRGGDGGGRSEEGRQSADVMYASGFVWCGVNVSVFACVLARLDGEGEEASSAGLFRGVAWTLRYERSGVGGRVRRPLEMQGACRRGAQALGCASRAKSALGPVLVHSFPATARLEPAPLPLVPKRTAHAMACFSEH